MASTCPPSPSASAGGCPFAAGRAETFDPFADAYQQDPAGTLRWSRDEQPVFWSPVLGYWVVTRYDDVKAVFRDHETFSPAIALEKITPTGPEAEAVLASYGYAMNRTLVNEDEPAHMPRRRLLMEPFTPPALKGHEAMVRELVREYVDRFIDDGRADLVDQMLWEVPLTVALHFLGVPEEDMPLLRRYSIAHTVNTWGRPKPQEQVAVAHAVGRFWQFAGEVLAKMRADPSGPGWMRYGIRMQTEQPDVVTDSYLHSMMMAGIVAAHETTANAAANALKLLLSRPEAWKQLCADPALIPNAVEECLRLEGSVAAWRRIALRDTVVGGVPIPAGGKLLIVNASGNHDERHFPDADRIDLRRGNASDHLTFGYGAHQCMGKNLARMELQVILAELTRRLPHMRLAPQSFSYVPNTSFRGPEHLWVQWDPAANPERRSGWQPPAARPVVLGEPSRHTVARPLVVARAERLAAGIVRLRLVAADGGPLPRWTAGAHVDIECGDPARRRSYSLCGDPDDTHAWEIAVLLESAGRGGSAWIHAEARDGAVLRVHGPRNHFRLDESARRLLLIAGGIGITPIAAMARRARTLGIDYTLHYCGRSRAAMAMAGELAALHGERLQLHAADEGRRADFAALLAEPQPGTRIQACGPARLLDALARASAHWPQDTLRVEHFSAAAPLRDPADERPFEVALRQSGLVLQVAADRTLLATLRGAGIDVESNCEEGLCGSCEVPVRGGEIDHRDLVLTRAERDANDRMMACCSRARGGRLVLDL